MLLWGALCVLLPAPRVLDGCGRGGGECLDPVSQCFAGACQCCGPCFVADVLLVEDDAECFGVFRGGGDGLLCAAEQGGLTLSLVDQLVAADALEDWLGPTLAGDGGCARGEAPNEPNCFGCSVVEHCCCCLTLVFVSALDDCAEGAAVGMLAECCAQVVVLDDGVGPVLAA